MPSQLVKEGDEGYRAGTLVTERYRLIRRLGRGGMGEVFDAEDLRLGQRVALKLLAPRWYHDPILRERFLDEVRFARRVSHPNVCQVYDLGEAGDTLFLTMEEIEGEDLRRLLARGPLPRERAIEVSLQICRGLAAIHDRGLLHRDLKPGNVMIGVDGRVLLTDFGLAAPIATTDDPEAGDPEAGDPEAGDPEAGDPEVGEMTAGGTVAYMAPELLVGGSASLRSDLYALGAVIYELFTARHPHPGHALMALARHTRGDRARVVPPVELTLEPGLDPTVAHLVRWCLATDPKDRPASAEAVEAALQPETRPEPGALLATLLVSDPADRDGGRTAALLGEYGGREVATEAGPCWLFAQPWAAVGFAVAWRASGPANRELARLAIHLGEITLELRERETLYAVGPEMEMARRLAAMARPGQSLLTHLAFELARRHHGIGELTQRSRLRWLAHGKYQFGSTSEPVELFEVGLEGAAPFLPPESSANAQAVAEGPLPGWRPAPGALIPQRPGWQIERQLGTGGFGDVWLARATRDGEPRVFKFCYDVERLSTLQREITIFRLLGEELGERPDIVRVIAWSFEEPPYFIESEHISGGSLPDWAEMQGGIAAVSLNLRLEIVAQVATALAAAHSVGVLHKDVKPTNVLIAPGGDGEIRARLGDFGVGMVTDLRRLERAGITALGLREAITTFSSHSAGTTLYLAPEVLEGHPSTVRSDIYALGVMLYQMVVGSFSRVPATGWQREIDDEILRQDIHAAIEGSPARRLGDANGLAKRLRSLEQRRQRAELERQQARRAERAQHRSRIMTAALVLLALGTVIVSAVAWRIAREAERAEREASSAQQTADFLVQMFEQADPFENPSMTNHPLMARDVLDQGARRLEQELADQPEIRARLINTIGRVYQRLGHYEAALEQFERALALRRKTLGEDHPAVSESAHDLAWLLHLMGDRERSESLLRQTLRQRRLALGNEHLYVANTLHDLAWVLQARGDLVGAEDFARQSLEIKRRLLGEKDRRVAASLNLLAFLVLEKGDPAAAEPFARQAVATTRGLWGEHPDVAESLNGLARVLLAQGRAAAAETPAREALEMRQRLLGEEHVAIAQSLHDLGSILLQQGNYQQAEPLLDQALAMYQHLMGDDHPGATMCRQTLASLYRASGRPEKADTVETPAE